MEPNKAKREPDDQSATVVPIITAAPPPVLNLNVLQECSEHTTDDGDPLLYFADGQKPSDVLKEAVEVVVAENNARLALGGFQRDLIFRNGKGGGFVTLAKDDTDTVVIKPLSAANISMALQARFCYLAGQKKKVHRPNPGWFASALTYADTEYRFPMLAGLLQHPAIHLDGTIVTREGYDPVTKCWVVAGWENLKFPAKPTDKQVIDAVQTLREPFSEVIFKGDVVDGQSPVKGAGVEMTASEANVLGMLLTGFLRKQMEITPFFPITSSQWGTAKGLIAQIVSHIVQRADPATVGTKKTADQAEKNIDRCLKDHPDELIIQIDETGGKWHSDQLALIATTDKYINRAVYGTSSDRIDTRRLFVVTGRNLQPDKDMTRRVSYIELDIPKDGTKPEERTFKHANRANKALLLEWVDANRERFVIAVATLVTAWKVNGRKKANFNFDFPHWVDVVGGVMQNAGINAWMANRDDPNGNEDEALRASFILAMMGVKDIGSGPISSRKLAEALKTGHNDVRDLLMWDDPWAQKLFRSWGDDDQMTYDLSRLLGSMKGELMSDGNGGRVTVTAYVSAGKPMWLFNTPGKDVEKPSRGRPTKKAAAKTA